MRFRINIKQKISASTLIEAIVAMLIVTIIFALAMMLMASISKNSNNSIKTKAYLLTNEVYKQTKSQKLFIDQEYNYDNIIIKKTISPLKDQDELYVLSIAAWNRNNYKLAERNEIIILRKQ